MTTTDSEGRDSGRKSSKELWRIFGPAIAIALVGFVVAFSFMKPAPPRNIVIATGSKEGAYFAFATRYAERLAEEGITLEVRETSGSVENLELLGLEDGDVDVALLQGGVSGDNSSALVSLGSVYYEPLWIFVGKELAQAEGVHLSTLGGKSLSVGAPGSGTRALAMGLLSENGIAAEPTRILDLGTKESVEALLAGRVDAVFFVAGHDAPLVRQLLADDRVRPLSLRRAEAYTRRHHYLGRVVLPEGVSDLERNLPEHDVSLVAPVANLVAREDLHPALVVLLLEAATEVHGAGGILERPEEFPSSRYASFALHDDARHYLKSGPPFLLRFLPFWAAIFVDRMVIFLIPLLTILIPLFKILPPTYRWRVRSRIYRWYRELMTAEREASADPRPAQLEKHLADLERMRREIGQIKVPLSYADELYDLHVHVELVRQRLRVQLDEPENA